jgi:hypothetical protein
MELDFSKEEQDKLDAIKSARAKKATERNEKADAAHKMHLFGHAEGDKMQLIVYSMSDAFGGKVIYKVPAEEFWEVIQKKTLDAIIKDKKGTQGAVAAIIAENKNLLLYPDVSELQAWKKEVPGFYLKIKEAFEERCDEGKEVSGK